MTITTDMVKALREETGAAILDCKKALEQHEGNFDKARAYLMEKGLATAMKKADRVVREGIVEAYQHPGGRLGVIVEVNCETDFVARTERFQQLAHDLALHIAFADPRYLDVGDIPASVLEQQRRTAYAEAQSQGKPDPEARQLAEESLTQFFDEVCLLRQPFVKDEGMTVGDLVTRAIADLRENIRVSRFARFELGGAGGDGGDGEA